MCTGTMVVHDVVKRVNNSRFLANMRKVPCLGTKIKRGGGPHTLKLATWQAKWVMAAGPKVAHPSSEMAMLDVEVGNFVGNLHCLSYRKVAKPPRLCRKVGPR